MAEPFIGEIKMVGFNFPPLGWAGCDGATLSISQNTALFSLLGTQFGGDGRTTFQLPDMRGRVPIHQGSAPGLSPFVIGQTGGAEAVALNAVQMPQHSHSLQGTSAAGNTRTVSGAALAREAAGQTAVYNNAPTIDSTLNPSSIGISGGGQPHENHQPFLTVNFIIALQGIFPARG
ncbi:MAG TPA: tail fiber protein [Armatimonadota bacterium]|jgi:microcystin-dependent protein